MTPCRLFANIMRCSELSFQATEFIKWRPDSKLMIIMANRFIHCWSSAVWWRTDSFIVDHLPYHECHRLPPYRVFTLPLVIAHFVCPATSIFVNRFVSQWICRQPHIYLSTTFHFVFSFIYVVSYLFIYLIVSRTFRFKFVTEAENRRPYFFNRDQY